MLTAEQRKNRATLAQLTARANRDGRDPATDPAVKAARRDYYASALEGYIQRVVDAAPPLTPEQRERLAAILRGGGLNGAA